MKPYIKGMKLFHTSIVIGYLLICLLAGNIMYLWFYEWHELEMLEKRTLQIVTFQQKIHIFYGQVTEFSLLGETILEWNDEDLEHYHTQRMMMDSMLCYFKTTYPSECIDSMRHLLKDKEQQMRSIITLLDEQQILNEKMARQVPAIVQKSVQEQPKKSKRKGFLGIFGKKEEVKPTVTTTMLRSLDRDMIAEQRAQSHRLSEHADSLATRNAELNRQLQGLIRQIDSKIQADLQKRETEIAHA